MRMLQGIQHTEALEVPELRVHQQAIEYVRGEAIDGPLRGQQLTRVAAHPAVWFGLHELFPDSTIWRLSR